MILRNFIHTRTKGHSCLTFEYFAEVDVTLTEGFLWWRKEITERREIRREFIGCWHFTDNGEYTPYGQAEALERAWKAKHGEM